MEKNNNQDVQDKKKKESEQKKREDEELDEELKQTFPASDPLSYSRPESDKKTEE
ncbi:MAG: hypothetical protein WEA56_00790 [Balneolaceae bacterium]